MRVLLDNNVNWRFGRFLNGHEISHVQDLGWDKLTNGDLIKAAGVAEFQAIITCDKNMSYQQNIADRRIIILVLNSRNIRLTDIGPLSTGAKNLRRRYDGGCILCRISELI